MMESATLPSADHAHNRMRWVPRQHIRVNRTATAWLVRWFIDPDAASERAGFLYDALYARLRSAGSEGRPA
jgi:hypothetical protein